MVNQVQYHVGEGADPGHLKSYLDAKGIVMQAYSALGQGVAGLVSGNLTGGIGRAHGKTAAQVALRWVTQKGVPLVTKASDPQYLKEDIDVLDWDLTQEEVGALDAQNCTSINATGRGACMPSYWCAY